MYTLDVCNLDSAPSVPRRSPSMKKCSIGRIEKERRRQERENGGEEGREEETEEEKVDVASLETFRERRRQRQRERVTAGRGGRGTDGGNEREGKG